MPFFKDHIYRKYMSEEMDEHEFIKRLKVAFEQEAKLHPEKQDIIYEGKDIELIHLVCEEYLLAIQFQKEVSALYKEEKERALNEDLEQPIEEAKEDTDDDEPSEIEVEPPPILTEDPLDAEILMANEKAKLANRAALKKRQEAYRLEFERQKLHKAEYDKLIAAYRRRQAAALSYEKINKDGHFQFNPDKLIEKEKKALALEDLCPSFDRTKGRDEAKNSSGVVSTVNPMPSAFFDQKEPFRYKQQIFSNPVRNVRTDRFAHIKQMKYEKEKALWEQFNKANDNKSEKIKNANKHPAFSLNKKLIQPQASHLSRSQAISQRRASEMAERFQTFREKAKSTHQMAERVLSGLGYTNFSYRITQSGKHYLTSELRTGDETKDIVTLTESLSSATRIGYSMISAVSFGTGYKQSLIDKSIKELIRPEVSALKQTLKMKRAAFEQSSIGQKVFKNMPHTLSGTLKNDWNSAKLTYLTDRFQLEHVIKARIKKAMKSRQALYALLAEFITGGQDMSALKKELKLLILKKRKGLLTDIDAKRLAHIQATILLQKAYDAKQKSKIRPRALLYSIMALARRAAYKSSETGMEGLLKLVDLGTNIYLYKTLKAFFMASIFFTKKTAKASRFLGKQYLTKTASGKAIHDASKKVTSKISGIRKHIFPIGKKSLKTAAATKGSRITKRGIQTSAAAAKMATTSKMTVLGTKRALSIPRKILTIVTYVPRKLVLLFQAVSTAFSKIFLYVGAAILSVVLICILIEFLSSSVLMILADDEKDGKIDLTPYVEMIETESREFSKTIISMTTQTASNGTSYENIYYNLSTTDNTKEILSMAAVRFGQELSMEHTHEEVEDGECDNIKELTDENKSTKVCAGHREAAESYIKNLYNTSHLLSSTESAPYDCGKTNTCTRKEKKTDSKLEKVVFSKMTGKELSELDLSGYIDVHYDDAGNPLYGYKKMNVTTYRCPGNHVDVTITSTVLKFNDIFASDDIAYSGLGDVAFSFESGSDPWMCVDDSALKDGSGYNYGLLSMTLKSGSIKNFMPYLSSYDSELYQKFAGLTPGTEVFNAKWTSNWSGDETNRMINAQRSFAWMQYGSVAVNKCMQETGVDLSRSRALMEVAISRGLNNPNTDWYSGSGITATMSDEEIITAMYDYIYANVDTFWPGQTQNHSGLKARMLREKALLLTLCNTQTETISKNGSWEGWTVDNIEWAKSLYEQDWDKIYTGYKETYLNWGGSGIAIEIQEKEFEKILSVLDSKIGSPYVWGATGPNTFDCSGLVKYVYETAGVYDFKGVRPTTKTLYAQCIPISSNEAKQGDLVLWDVPGNIHHVAIYCGNGIVCHAPRTGDVVRYAKLWGAHAFFRLPEQ